MMNMIYDIFRKGALLALIAVGLTSCLDKLPGDAIPEDEGMQTFNDAEQTLTGIYSAFMSGSLYSGYLTLLPDIQADLVHAVQGNSNTYGNLWQWDIRPTNSPEIEAVYGALYRVISRCNYYLDKVDALRDGLTDDQSITYLDYYTGEVYCARAMAYSELIKCFCKAYDPDTAENELGVALDSTYYGKKPVKRSSLKDSYAFVIRDLEKAEELLEDAEYGYSAPYFTYASANAIHARVALYMQNWADAIEYSTKLIEDKAYSLSTSAAYTSGVSPITGASKTYNYIDYMWTNDLSTEIIWMVDYTLTSYGGALGQSFLNFNNDFVYYYPDYVPSDWVLKLYASTDARYNAYFTNLQTGYAHALVWPLLTKYFGDETFIANRIYHVSRPKPLRLAEQYLIRAEAYCRMNQNSKGAADIAALRKARYTGNASASLGDDWLTAISEERVRELYMEGFRLHDLKRWHMGFERKPQTSAQPEGSTLKIEKDDPLFVWPIPQNELEAPGSQIQPNESNR